jgi:microcystin degradation protein MlrC
LTAGLLPGTVRADVRHTGASMSKRVLTAQVMHETNTFSKVPTDLDSFRRGYFLGENEIPSARRGTRTALGATFEAADKFGWTLSHPVAASANPSGIVTKGTFEHLAGMLLQGVSRAGKLDGALLHLHGAMVVEGYEDGEGELLRRLRAAVGPDLPIIVTLDLHANVSDDMAKLATALIAFRTYPHIDMYERAWQGAELLERVMRGAVKPTTVIARRPLLFALDGGKTQGGPMAELLHRAEALEHDGKALVISVCAGFAPADIRDAGPTVTVTGEGGAAALQVIAESFMDHAWQTRTYRSTMPLTPDAAVKQAKSGESGATKPLVIADVTDNPGSGHYGDATNLLAAMIRADLRNAAFHAIYDADAVRQAERIGVGREGTITLGGRTDPSRGGAPLTLGGKVVALTDGQFIAYGPMGGGVWRNYGLSMLFRVGGIDIVGISNNGQATDLAQLTSLGVEPTRKATIAVKSNHHFRAAFQPIAREVLTVDGGGLGSVTAKPDGYQNIRRPVWPLDQIQ